MKLDMTGAQVVVRARGQLDLHLEPASAENRSQDDGGALVHWGLVTLLSALLAGPIAFARASTTSTDEPARGGGPVVLELFTSQGCSTCPPADRVLSRLGLDEKTRARVVPLAFHVDYWNRAEWTDPFSAREWSARQDAYNRVFRLDGVYTPQLVVNGRAQLNGRDQERAMREIAADLERPPAVHVSLAMRKGRSARPGLAIDVAAEVTEGIRAGKLQVLVALFENGLLTPVESGENGGRTLRNDFVVRRLEKAFSLEPKAGARGRRTLDLELRSAWRLENVGVAAFLQDPGTMWIYAAAVQASPGPGGGP